MSNTWIVVPVQSAELDLASFVDNLTGKFVAPATYESVSRDEEGNEVIEVLDYPFTSAPDFSGKIVFVQSEAGYTEYDGVTHLEDFGDYNVYRRQNTGIEYAVAQGAGSIVVMSSVISVDPNAFVGAAELLVEGIELVTIESGAVFVLSATSELRPDDRFKVWFGDTDLLRRAADKLDYFISPAIKANYIETVDAKEELTSADQDAYNEKWS